MNHSIADAVAFAIHTRMGTVVHTGDFKIDSTPIDGEMIDLARFGELGKRGRAGAAGGLHQRGAPGLHPSASGWWATAFDRQFQRLRASGSSSPPSPPTCTASSRSSTPPPRYGRKVAVTGRSMENIMKVVHGAGLSEGAQGHASMDISHIKSLPKNKQSSSSPPAPRARTCPPCTGWPSPPTSRWTSAPGTGSSSPPPPSPATRRPSATVINELFRKGADVVYDKRGRRCTSPATPARRS